MRLWFFFFFFFSNLCLAEVGRVTKIIGESSFLIRHGSRLALSLDQSLELDDEIHAEDSYVVLYIFPATQISLSKNSSIKISESLIEENAGLEKSFSVIDYIKGIVRLQVTKSPGQQIEQKVQASGVSFGVRGTEFEVSSEAEDVDLDVIEGEVIVSSPYVQTLVPEIVKANEGFRFERKKKNFARRKFREKFKNHPGFDGSERIRKKWLERKVRRLERNNGRKPVREIRREQKKDRRHKR